MFARTERLLLRPGWLEDAPALARAIGEEAVVRNLARAPWPYGMDEAQDFLGRPVSFDAFKAGLASDFNDVRQEQSSQATPAELRMHMHTDSADMPLPAAELLMQSAYSKNASVG